MKISSFSQVLGFSKKIAEDAIAKAMPKAIKSIEKELEKNAFTELTLRKSEINKKLKIRYYGNQTKIVISSKAVRLAKYRTKQLKKRENGKEINIGVRVQVYKKGSQKVSKRLFYAVPKNTTSVGLFVRRGKERLPIDQQKNFLLLSVSRKYFRKNPYFVTKLIKQELK